jgi:hypothetical protein
MSTYTNLDASVRRVEIGSTWYARSAQRTAINTECKLLLLRHAFEVLDVIAVEFRTSSLNLPSRKAIERLGATYDGTMRNHMRMPNGTLRDTCVYSILPEEWPGVEAKLLAKLPALREMRKLLEWRRYFAATNPKAKPSGYVNWGQGFPLRLERLVRAA